MTKILNFFQNNKMLFRWTAGYFLCLWMILKFVFDFNMLSKQCWVKFFSETLHGFWGLVFVVTIYGAILIYIATAMIVYRKNKPILEIPVPDTVKNISSNISKMFSESKTATPSDKDTNNTTQNSETTDDGYPRGLPPELYVPYMRAKNHMTTNTAVSDFNKQPDEQPTTETPQLNETESFPIPNDFDISDDLPDTQPQTQTFDTIPTFKDLDFDTPIQPTTNTDTTQDNKNSVIKYCEQNGIEYESVDDFIMMKKYLIYTHDDEDFWIMDDDNWFASGKQKKSPVQKLIDMADQNSLGPVIYFETKNVMDIEHVISGFERKGIRVIMSLSELP